MRVKNLAFFLFLLGFSFSVFAGSVGAGGFGVSPPSIIADNLLRGSEYEHTVYFVQSEPDQDLQVELAVDAPGIADWISVDRGTSFVLPKDQQQFPITVRIKVPEDAPLGKYEGFIRISTQPSATKQVSEGSNVSINLGGRIDLDLTVGNDVIEEYKILSLDIKDIEPGWPLVAILKVENTGNVPILFDSATFELFDKFNASRLSFIQTDRFESVPAYATREMILKFPLDLNLGLGEYSGTVRIFKDEKVVKEIKTPFDLVAKGTLPYNYGDAAPAGSAAGFPYAYAGVALLVGAGAGFIFLRRRRRARSAFRVRPLGK